MSSLPQPVVVYPQSTKAQNGPSSEGGGSLTAFYVVLSVIAVLTLAACFAGQVLARRCLRPTPRRDRADKGDVHDGGGAEMGPPAAATMEAAGAKPMGVKQMGGDHGSGGYGGGGNPYAGAGV